MREVKVKDRRGLVYKMEGRLATGVKDTRNNKEIYEGDILNVLEVLIPINEEIRSADVIGYEKRDYITPVIYDEGTFVLKSGGEDYDTFLIAWASDNSVTYPYFETEVIGNIYRNPELLKGDST